MKIKATTELYGQAAGGQSDSSSLIGRKYRVVDTRYGQDVSEHDTPEEAEHAARARPYSKVQSQPDLSRTPAVRDMARARAVQTNPDVDFAAVDPIGVGDEVFVDGLPGMGIVMSRAGKRLTIRMRDRGMWLTRDERYVHNISDNTYKSIYKSGG